MPTATTPRVDPSAPLRSSGAPSRGDSRGGATGGGATGGGGTTGGGTGGGAADSPVSAAGGNSSSGAATARSGEAGGASGKTPTLRLLRAARTRFVAGKGRGTTIVFRLSAPARIHFTVLSQGPDCRRLGSFSRQGRRGVNRVRFFGRLHGRPLPPGTYTLVPSLVRGQKRIPLAPLSVEVVSARRELSAAEARTPVKVQCLGSGLAARDVRAKPSAAPSGGASAPTDSDGRPASAQPTAAGGAGTPVSAGVAGASETRESVDERLGVLANVPLLSQVIPHDPPVPPFVLAVLALVAIGVGSLLLLALVLRYHRGTWVP